MLLTVKASKTFEKHMSLSSIKPVVSTPMANAPSLDSVTPGSTLSHGRSSSVHHTQSARTYSALPSSNGHSGKVGERRYNHINSDIQGHKDTKNKALTVNMKRVHNPGSSGKHGTLNPGDHRLGVSARALLNKRVKLRKSAATQTASAIGTSAAATIIDNFHTDAPVRSVHAGHFGYGGVAEYAEEEPAMLAPNDVPSTNTTEIGQARGLHYTLQGQDENDPTVRADKENFMRGMSKGA